MWRHVVFLLLIVAAALALSILLVPRGQELALMHYKARSYGDALSGFENAFYGQGVGPTLVVPLSNLYLREGELDAAVEAIDRTLAERPRDLEALDLALDVYRDTVRRQRYIDTLARRVQLAPSANLVRRLVDIHALRGDRDGEQRALAELVGSGEATDAEYLRLARAYAADDNDIDALETTRGWLARPGTMLTRRAVDFALELFARHTAPGDAARALKSWLGRTPAAPDLMHALVLARRYPALALLPQVQAALAANTGNPDMLAPAFAVAVLAERPEILSEYAASLDLNTTLRALRRGGLLLAPLKPAHAALLDSMVAEAAPQLVGPAVIGALVDSAQADLLHRIARRTGPQPDLNDPVTAAGWFALLADRQRARAKLTEADRADASDLRILSLLLATGQSMRAREVLRTFTDWPADELPAVAWMYHDAGMSEVGYARLGSSLATGDSAAQASRVLLAAGSEAHDVVTRWLRERSGDATPVRSELLFELAMQAVKRDAGPQLAMLSELALYATDTDLPATERARRLLSAGDARRAAAAAAVMVRDDEMARAVFDQALQLVLAGRDVDENPDRALRAGLEYLVDAALAASSQATDNRSELHFLAYDLMSAGADELAFNVVERLVKLEPEGWYDAYRDLARSSGQLEHFMDHVVARLELLEARDPRRDLYIFDLTRLGGRQRVRPHLEARIERTTLDAARRKSAFYAWRETVVEETQTDYAVERLRGWLQTYGPRDPLFDSWLYELSQLGGPRAVLPWLEMAAADPATDANAQAAAFYTFEATAARVGQTGRVTALAARRVNDPATAHALVAVYAAHLFERAEREMAGEALAALATGDPDNWAEAYLAWLDESGSTTQALHYMSRLAGQDRLGPELLNSFADRLLKAGDKSGAIALYKRLAGDEALDGPNMNTLLWLWGPRPDGDAIAWLTERARAAHGRERAAWAGTLTRLGARASALRLLDEVMSAASVDPLIVEVYAQLLADKRDKPALSEFLEGLLRSPDELSAPMARWVAQTASEFELPALSANAWAAVLNGVPGDTDALRHLGLEAFDRGQRGDAERYLRRLLALVDDDMEAHFFYAEVLTERGFESRASSHYQRVLDLAGKDGRGSFRVRVMRAQSLHRLGFRIAALEGFERLLKERPGEGHLRADYVTMLLDNREVKQARAVLAERRAAP